MAVKGLNMERGMNVRNDISLQDHQPRHLPINTLNIYWNEFIYYSNNGVHLCR